MSRHAARSYRGSFRTLGSPILLIVIPALLAACGNEGPAPSNRAPTVTLSPEPVEGDTVSYHLTIAWTGTDPDGRVTGYRYAVDPPAGFTEAEIAGGGEGIVSTEIAGASGAPDTTRVIKIIEGRVASFDWIHTPDPSHRFLFSATTADSEAIGSTKRPTGRFTGMHAVYVRAVDDRGAFSVPAHVAFTATTIAPTATIAYPHYGASALSVGAAIQVEAEGTDPDGGGAPPVGYYYRIVTLNPLLTGDIPANAWTRLWSPATEDPGWVLAAGPGFRRTFPLAPGDKYAVGIRAVDVAGAVEPFLDLGRNAILFEASSEAPSPVVTISEPTLGTFTFPGAAKPGPEVTSARIPLRFTVSCSAEEYGGDCDAMRWGLDIADLDRSESWSDWKPVGALPPLTLPDVGTQVLYFQVRDTQGGVTTPYLLLHLTDTPMDRAALFVDDVRNLGGVAEPNDATVDAYWEGLFEDSGRFSGTTTLDSLSTFATYGLNDMAQIPPISPDLGAMGRFRLIVWNANLGYNGRSALFQVTGYQNHNLASYLAAGGKLWVCGSQTAAGMTRGFAGHPYVYPLAPRPGDFAYDFMKLASGRIENTALSPSRPGDSMIGVEPFPGVPTVYPAMATDTTRSILFRSGPYADLVIDPIDASTIPGFPATGKIDSLYVYRAADPASPYDGALTAIRYRDLDPNRSQGRTQWFGFDLYWMRKDQAQEMFNRTIDWFRRESGP